MSHRMFTVSTGLEVLAEVDESEDTPTYFIAKRPLVISPVPQGDDSYALAFVPFSPADTEGSVRIYYANVVAENVNVPDELIRAYTSRHSGIEIASSLVSAAQ